MNQESKTTSPDPNAWLSLVDSHYEIISTHFLQVGKQEFLGSRDARKCRFCGKSPPDVAFRTDAHAFPEAIGNKSLFTFYECDTCNQKFGGGIEDHFAKYTAPLRCLSQVRGKKGVPTVASQSGDGWRITLDDDEMIIKQHLGKEIVDIDEANNFMDLTVELQPYIPAAVFKAYLKMALSVMPEAEIQNFTDIIQWIQKPVDDPHLLFQPLLLLQTMVPGPLPFPQVSAFLLKRRSDELPTTYMSFVVAFGNYAHQIFIPSRTDSQIGERTMNLPRFPTPYDLWPSSYGTPTHQNITLSSTSVVRKETRKLRMHFDKAVHRPKV